MAPDLLQVNLNGELIELLLKGLYNGASGKLIKVVIDVNQCYHIQSKGLQMVIEGDENNKIRSINIHNVNLSAKITSSDLQKLRLKELGDKVVAELHKKYSPAIHSLADNIIVFNKAYGD